MLIMTRNGISVYYFPFFHSHIRTLSVTDASMKETRPKNVNAVIKDQKSLVVKILPNAPP